MWTSVLWILIGVGIFWILYLLIKHYSKVLDSVISMAPKVTAVLNEAVKIFDNNPNEQSTIERIVYYADIAVKAVEQSYKKTKELEKEMLKDGKISEQELEDLYKAMKEEAVRIVKELAEADNFELPHNAEVILDSIIEAMVFFLPKSKS